MKKTLFIISLLLNSLVQNVAAYEKSVYIPDEWKNQGNNKLYSDTDANNEYTWSLTRSVQNDDLVIFWDNGYGNTKPSDLPTSDFYHVDINDLMKKCQAYYDLNYKKLCFVDATKTNVNRYKMMVLLCHTQTWTCYGGGYDYEINALWINPSTCKPIGFAVAHEVGHSFHYMCYADATNNNHSSSQTIGTGFHLPVGSGQAIWEQTAQWQAAQYYPESMFSESIGAFRNTHSLAFSHEVHRYQSYWLHYYLAQKYNDITTIAKVWQQPMTGASDFNQALMKLKNLTPEKLYRLYFDYACRCVTWDFDACAPYRAKYIGDFNDQLAMTDDGAYQITMLNCPQSSGFNVIPLQVPEAGNDVTIHFTALPSGSNLAATDPGQYMKGINDYVTLDTAERHYINNGRASQRGFRLGFVALLKDGTRKYISADKVYCKGNKVATEDVKMTTPDNVSRLWFVVSPAPAVYFQHQWNDDISDDDMWPYRFTIDGTDISATAQLHASPTIDCRDIANTTITYDVNFPYSSDTYPAITLNVSGKVAATLGTAFQTKTSDIASKMQAYSTAGPDEGKIMFYAVNPDGTLAQSGSTANSYGHWFSGDGNCVGYNGNSKVYSEFNASALSFTLGQYPKKCAPGEKYTIRQALRYHDNNGKYATATFVFNITLGDQTSYDIKGIDYTNPEATAISGLYNNDNAKSHTAYDLLGRKVTNNTKGIIISNGRKIVKQ